MCSKTSQMRFLHLVFFLFYFLHLFFFTIYVSSWSRALKIKSNLLRRPRGTFDFANKSLRARRVPLIRVFRAKRYLQVQCISLSSDLDGIVIYIINVTKKITPHTVRLIVFSLLSLACLLNVLFCIICVLCCCLHLFFFLVAILIFICFSSLLYRFSCFFFLLLNITVVINQRARQRRQRGKK